MLLAFGVEQANQAQTKVRSARLVLFILAARVTEPDK